MKRLGASLLKLLPLMTMIIIASTYTTLVIFTMNIYQASTMVKTLFNGSSTYTYNHRNTHTPKIFLYPRYLIKNTQNQIECIYSMMPCLVFEILKKKLFAFLPFRFSLNSSHQELKTIQTCFWVHKRSNTLCKLLVYMLWYEFLFRLFTW